jgi:hypothetical protein
MQPRRRRGEGQAASANRQQKIPTLGFGSEVEVDEDSRSVFGSFPWEGKTKNVAPLICYAE